MSDVPIFLAFPDRVLGYDCASCDQRCCKGSGLPVFPAERDHLIRLHPALELVAPGDASRVQIFSTPPSGCWFLEGPKCSLLDAPETHMNRQHSHHRPVFCTLFPFVQFGLWDDVLVVAPSGNCPLTVSPGAGVPHADVIELLRKHGAAGAPPRSLRRGGRAAFPLEALLRTAAEGSLAEPSPVPLLAFARLATDAHAQGALDGLSVEPMGAVIAAYYARLDAMAELVGVPPLDDADLQRVAAILAGWTPTMRAFGFDDLPLGQVPEAMLALAFYAADWQRLRPSQPLIPQALMQLVSSLGPTLRFWATYGDAWSGAPVAEPKIATGAIPAEVLPAQFAALGGDLVARTRWLRRLAAAAERAA